MIGHPVRRFYANHWNNFSSQFGISLELAEFDSYGHCCGLKIPLSEFDESRFSSLKTVDATTTPPSRVVLYGTRKLRFTTFNNFVAVSEE